MYPHPLWVQFTWVRVWCGICRPTVYLCWTLVKEERDKQSENFHFYYDHQAGGIILQCVPSAVHQSTHFLNMDLPSALQPWVDDLALSTTMHNYGDEGHDLYTSKSYGIQMKGKSRDASIRVCITGKEIPIYPHILCKVGYSEDDHTLLEDAEHWLLQTDKEVLCVIVIKLTNP